MTGVLIWDLTISDLQFLTLQEDEQQRDKDADSQFDAADTPETMFAFEHEDAGEGDEDQCSGKDVREPRPRFARVVVELAQAAQERAFLDLLQHADMRGEIHGKGAVALQEDLERCGIGVVVLNLFALHAAEREPFGNRAVSGQLMLTALDAVLTVECRLMVKSDAADGVHQQHARKHITQFAVDNTKPLTNICHFVI